MMRTAIKMLVPSLRISVGFILISLFAVQDLSAATYQFNGRQYLLNRSPETNITSFNFVEKSFNLIGGNNILSAGAGPTHPSKDFTWIPPITDEEINVLPDSVDLSKWQTSIRDQGKRASCTFFSTIALIESIIKKRQGIEIDLSEEFFVKFVKEIAHFGDTIDGSHADWNLLILADSGLVLENDEPYKPSWFLPGMPCENFHYGDKDVPPHCYSHGAPVSEILAKAQKIDSTVYRVYRTLSELSPFRYENYKFLLHELAHNRPVVIGLQMNADHIDKLTGEILLSVDIINECQQKPERCGDHSVLAVGYNKNTNKLKIKNSWGEDWGEGGYGYIDMDYLKNGYFDVVTADLDQDFHF